MIFLRLWLSLLLTLLQIAMAASLSDKTGILEKYESLLQWDSAWYESIASSGYRSTVPPVAQKKELSNVAFFPAYPMLASAVAKTAHLSVKAALLATSQLCTVLFWFYFLSLLACFQFSAQRKLVVTVTALLNPSSFFLVTGYSESLFLASHLGALFWSLRHSFLGFTLCSLHGFAASSTRLLGVSAAAMFPFLRRKEVGMAMATISLAGAGLFFFYCQVKFGAWDLYFSTSKVGWKITSDATAFLHSGFWVPHAWKNYGHERFVFLYDHASVLFTILLGLFALGMDLLLKRKLDGVRMALYSSALVMLLIVAVGKYTTDFASAGRYLFPAQLLLWIAYYHGLPSKFFAQKFVNLIIGVVLTGQCALAIWLTHRFVRGFWAG